MNGNKTPTRSQIRLEPLPGKLLASRSGGNTKNARKEYSENERRKSDANRSVRFYMPACLYQPRSARDSAGQTVTLLELLHCSPASALAILAEPRCIGGHFVTLLIHQTCPDLPPDWRRY